MTSAQESLPAGSDPRDGCCPLCRGTGRVPQARGLTRRMAEALAVIRARIAADGVAPSYAEIAAELGTVKSGAHRLVTALERRGHLARTPGHARALSLSAGAGAAP